MTRRLEFGKSEVDYLANLCHNCGACLHACQYAPPHEFAVNIPQAMARVRVHSYADYAWPRSLGSLYRHNGLALALALAAGLALFLLLALALNGTLAQGPLAGNFYRVFPHNLIVSMFAPIFLFALLALALGVRRFWADISPGERVQDAPRAAAAEATRDALRLKYLDGGHGEGCNEADDRFTLWRRRFHHFTFYGFMLCFASTSMATLYHYLFGRSAPYALTSLPVLLGTAGGIGLLIGPAGLLWLNLHRHPLHGDAAQKTMDRGFIALLLLASASGIALLAWRDSGAMALLLALHLGVVMALFLTLPYGKFAHGIFRSAALVKWAIEKRMPSNLELSED
jgi:citrate/tricarballylate utilization protein